MCGVSDSEVCLASSLSLHGHSWAAGERGKGRGREGTLLSRLGARPLLKVSGLPREQQLNSLSGLACVPCGCTVLFPIAGLYTVLSHSVLLEPHSSPALWATLLLLQAGRWAVLERPWSRALCGLTCQHQVPPSSPCPRPPCRNGQSQKSKQG